MSLNVQDKPSEKRKLPEPGNHPAVCIGVVDLGSHPNRAKDKMIPKIMFMFELLDEDYEWKDSQTGEVNETRALASVEFAAYFSKNAGLRKNLESWRGTVFTAEELEGFYLGNVIGKKCTVNVIHKVSAVGNPYMKIDHIGKYRQDPRYDELLPKRDLIVLSLDPDEFKPDLFRALSKNTQNQISDSPEYKELLGTANKKKESSGEEKPLDKEPEIAPDDVPDAVVEEIHSGVVYETPRPPMDENPGVSDEDDGLPF